MRYALALGILLVSSSASAQDKYLCCDLAAGATSTPCTASAQACAQSGAYSVMLADFNPSAGQDTTAVNPLSLSSSFPAGTDGYMYWSTATPHLGFCLVAPAAGDPAHANREEPIGCLDVTLKPGMSGEIANVVVPIDPRWDGYEFCYGGPDPQNGCQNLNDGWDATISQTPVSHSCCGPVQLLENAGPTAGTWAFELNQELPGIPPPVLIEQPDAGLVPFFNAASNDVYASSADAGCLTAYNESTTCGTLPHDGGSPSPSAPNQQGKDAGSATGQTQPTAGPRVGCSLAEGRPRASLLSLAVAVSGAWVRRRRRSRI